MRLPGWRWREAKQAHALGMAALNDGRYERAAEYFRIAVAIKPTLAPAWLNLGNALGNQGAHRAAIDCYRHAHKLDPLSPHPLVNAGYAHLTLGEWREGWWHYEQRWQLEAFRAKNGLPGADAGKRWDGIAREGQTLLVFNEQGAGDVIQMLRYVEDLAATGMTIALRVPANLFRLVRYSVPRSVLVFTDAERVPPHDWHVPFMSLPYHMGTNTPADVPYRLYYVGARRIALPLPGLKIGVVWAGSPGHVNDRNRSIGIEPLAPLFEIPGTSWVSLQVGPRAHEGEAYELTTIPTRDYWETAGVVAALDLVIAVDTSVAHLAGALGVPTLCMLPTPADWRWLLDSERTCWYDSMTLVRQKHQGEWSQVVRRVRDQIAILQQRRAA